MRHGGEDVDELEVRKPPAFSLSSPLSDTPVAPPLGRRRPTSLVARRLARGMIDVSDEHEAARDEYEASWARRWASTTSSCR